MRVGVFGAGAIGSYVGGALAAAGTDVVLLGRPRLQEAMAAGELRVIDLQGRTHTFPSNTKTLRVVTEPAELHACDSVLVTVKSRDTEAAAATLHEVLEPGCTVVSFQNGVDNPARLRAGLPEHEVLAGMVSFNVVWQSPATFRRGTSGPLAFSPGSARSDGLQSALERGGLDVVRPQDMPGIQWGKLLFNLNNAVNALSGLPLRDQLARRDFRRITAAAIDEGRAAAAAAGIRLRATGRMLPWLAPTVLRLPDRLFRLVARPMLRVDPQARSSMWEDLERARPTEIDDLNGAVVRLAEHHGIPTPVNRKLVQLVQQAQADGNGSPRLDAAVLWP